MQTFAQHALSGTILASALGAVVLCVILLFYGFKTEPDDERAPGRRVLLIRLGHAVAAACFAAALMLSTAALLDQRRAAVPAPRAPRSDELRRLEAQVEALEERLAAAESRASAAAPRVVTAAPVAPTTRQVVVARATLESR